MKYRTDFVTNSSSSSFVVSLTIELKNGEKLCFEGNGGSPENGRIDYFEADALIFVSPKQMCEAENVEELIAILTDGVSDGDEYDMENAVKIFEKSMPVDVFDFLDEDFIDEPESMKTIDAYDFIETIRKSIKNICDIKRVVLVGNEENYCHYRQKYIYNNETGEYTGIIDGCPFEKDGASGGYLELPDEDECDIEQTDTNA